MHWARSDDPGAGYKNAEVVRSVVFVQKSWAVKSDMFYVIRQTFAEFLGAGDT